MGYVELYAARAERRWRLRESKGFECECRRCRRPDSPREMRLSQAPLRAPRRLPPLASSLFLSTPSPHVPSRTSPPHVPSCASTSLAKPDVNCAYGPEPEPVGSGRSRSRSGSRVGALIGADRLSPRF